MKTISPSACNVDERPILGVRVASMAESQALAYFSQLIARREFTRVGFLNAHNANLAVRQPDYAEAIDAFLMLPDGIGVDLASIVFWGSSFPANLNGTDFIPALIKHLTTPITVALVGGTDEVVRQAAERLAAGAPQHRFIAIHSGYFDESQEADILQELESVRPDVLLVAMGTPRQEHWIHRKIDSRHCTLAVGVGGLFDFISGASKRAPALVRRLRFEWLYRLWLEPPRLWRRYILGNPAFLTRIIIHKLLGRVGPLTPAR